MGSSIRMTSTTSTAWWSNCGETEAELAARHSLRLKQNSSIGHYALALTLSAQNRLYKEAITSFQRASHEFAHAHLEAARFHERRGHKHKAYAELKQYLNTDLANNREEIERWASQLRREANVALGHTSASGE